MRDGARTLLLGSHFDSVRNGGKYDGVLGILVPIACVAELDRRHERLPLAIEVAAFSDEEGARFQTSFLSSRALIGRFDPALLGRRDADGVTLAQALQAAGLDPARVAEARIDPQRLAAYVEVHIEQGPVLLDEGLALGIVTTIAGGSRHRVRVSGESGHAGTVPMPRRHDALAAASEMVLALEQRCGAGGSLVGTVGILRVRDGTGNVIPGEVEFTCDIRAARGRHARGRGARRVRGIRRDRAAPRGAGVVRANPPGPRGAVRAMAAGPAGGEREPGRLAPAAAAQRRGARRDDPRRSDRRGHALRALRRGGREPQSGGNRERGRCGRRGRGAAAFCSQCINGVRLQLS